MHESDLYQQNVCEAGHPNAQFACSEFCDSWDREAAIGQVPVDCSPQLPIEATEEPCAPGMDGESLDSWGDPESTDGSLDRAASTATVTYVGESTVVPVGGAVAFTGGCASGECPISFSQIRLQPANFTMRDATGTEIRLVDVSAVNVGVITTTQIDGTFTIPRETIRVLAEAEVNGVAQALAFSPSQDLHGYYLPSRGTFGLHGDLVSGTDAGLRLELASGSMSRPPVANAGGDQSVALPPRSATATVTLDGTRSSDLDGNLDHIDWYEGSTYLGRGSTLRHAFSAGRHTVTAIAVDSTGKRNADTMTVTVR